MLTIGACSQGSTVEATIEPSAHWRTLALDNYRTLHHTLSPRSPQARATNNHSRILIDKLKGDLKRKQSSHLQDLVTHASMKSKNLQLAASLEDQRLVIAQLRQTNQRQAQQFAELQQQHYQSLQQVQSLSTSCAIQQDRLAQAAQQYDQQLSQTVHDYQCRLQSLAQENQMLRQQMERNESIQEQRRQVHLCDQPDYEDRVRALLNDMEQMTRDHQNDLASLREALSVSLATQAHACEKMLQYQNDAFEALQSERKLRQEMARMRPMYPKQTVNMKTIRHSESSFLTPETEQHRSMAALSNLCDKMLDSQNLVTAAVVATFELEPLMIPGTSRFRPKRELMEALEEYSNLINAMAALFFVSKQLSRVAQRVFCALRQRTS